MRTIPRLIAGAATLALAVGLAGTTDAAADPPRARVALFYDSSYVDTQDTKFGEARNLRLVLEGLGHDTAPFTGVTAANIADATAGRDVLVIPEQETKALAPDLDAAARSAITGFVGGGGTVIVHGEQVNGRTAVLLNELFGFALTETQVTGGPPATKSPFAAGTPFADGPATVPAHNGTSGLAATSLPAAARSIYDAGGNSVVTLIPHGSGSIVYLGWDWFDSNPPNSAGQDGTDWTGVLDTAVSSAVPNRPPVAQDVAVEADEARPVTVEISATDPDGDELTYSVSKNPSGGTVTGDGPQFTYTSDAGYSDTDTFAVDVCDPEPACDTATVTVFVAAFRPPATPPGDAGDMTVTPDQVKRGEQVTATGAGMRPGETVFLVLYSDPVRVGEAAADDTGRFSAEVTIPADAAVGEHTLVAYGEDSTLAADLTVTDDGGSGGGNGGTGGNGGSGDGGSGDGGSGGGGDGGSGGSGDGGATTGTGDGKKLALTGAPATPLLIGSGFGLLALGTAWLLAARRIRQRRQESS